MAFDLPLADPGRQPPERADAARNRRRILEAATALIGERGIEAVSMHDVAEAACVGTGTLYRRFGDRAGLALALLDEHTREFQNAMIAGPPPLGPGAPVRDRLVAFGHGYLELLEEHAGLLVAAEGPNRDAPGPHRLYLTHVSVLLRDGAPHVDAEYAAQALLAALAPGLFLHQRHGLGWAPERLREAWGTLVSALV